MSNARLSILQAKAVTDQRVSNSQFRTLAALGVFADKDGWCFPKLATLGDMLGKTKQAVSKDLIELEKLGYVLIVHQRHDSGMKKFSKYQLLFDTCQPDIDTCQPHVDQESTSEVDTVSTSEVDTLTSHINDPISLSIDATPGGKILYDRLSAQYSANRRRGPKKFKTTTIRDKWIKECEGRLAPDDLNRAIDAAFNAEILALPRLVAYVAKWGTNGRSNGKPKTIEVTPAPALVDENGGMSL